MQVEDLADIAALGADPAYAAQHHLVRQHGMQAAFCQPVKRLGRADFHAFDQHGHDALVEIVLLMAGHEWDQIDEAG